LVEETRVPGENHRLVISNWQTVVLPWTRLNCIFPSYKLRWTFPGNSFILMPFQIALN
jgi:hypothetical protein